MSKMAAGSEVGEGSKPKRRLEKRSKVWEHITEEEANGSTKAKCKYCDSYFKRDVHGNTSTLRRHLKDSCPKVPKEVRAQFLDKSGKEGIAQSSENNEREITIQPSKKRMAIDQLSTVDFGDEVRNGLTLEKMREIRVKDAILTDLPFAPPHIKEAWSSSMIMDIEKEICAYHQREKDNLTVELGNLTSHVSLSIDIMVEGWISIAAHFINDDFNLVKKLIGFKKLPFEKSRDEALNIIKKCIFDWKLDNKLLTIIEGRDCSFDPLLKKFQTKMLLNANINSVQSFNEVVENCYTEVYWVNPISKFFGHALQIGKDKGLSNTNGDWVKGRPISWYMEQPKSWKFYSIVIKILKEALLYKKLFFESSEHTDDEKDRQDFDWKELEEAVNCFEAINPIISSLFNFKYPTSNLHFLNQIKMHLLENEYDEFSYYFYGKVLNNFPIIYVACVLDPRYKLKFLKYCLMEIEVENYGERIDEILVFFHNLLAIYAKEEINQASSLSPETVYEGRSTLIKRYTLYIKKLKATERSELNQYLGDETVDHDIEDAHFDLLGWWKENGSRYPVLSRMARDVLAIPVYIYSVEEDLKLDLSVLQGASPELVEAVICSKDWILSDVQSLQGVGPKLSNKKPSDVVAPEGDSINNISSDVNFRTAEEKTDIVDKEQHNSNEIENIPKNSIQEAQPTPHKQFSTHNVPDEVEKRTKAAIVQVREKIQGTTLCDKFGLGLNNVEILAVEFVERIEQTVRIAQIEGNDTVCLTGEKMNSLVLRDSEDGTARWLCDEIIDAYINVINHRKHPSRKSLIVSTVQTQLLKGDWTMCENNLDAVIKLGFNILINDLVFFPINKDNLHWLVGVLNFKRREFQILDSRVMNYTATQNPYYKLTSDLRSGIQQCIRSAADKFADMQPIWGQVDITRWGVSIIPEMPQQTDNSSCGLFALKCVEFWNGLTWECLDNINWIFSQKDMEIFRKKMVGELIMSELNLMKVVHQEISKLLTEVKWYCY